MWRNLRHRPSNSSRFMNPDRFSKLTTALRRRQPDLTVLMERVHKSHNLSAILRNCDSVGVLEAHARKLHITALVLGKRVHELEVEA